MAGGPGRENFSRGDTVEAFQDSDGDWQVEDSFTTTWVARTFGFTFAGFVAFLVLTVVMVRDWRRGEPEAAAEEPVAGEPAAEPPQE